MSFIQPGAFDRAQPDAAPPRSLNAALAQGTSGEHAFVSRLLDKDNVARAIDLADAAHYLCLIHGRYPGLIDYAATRSADPYVGKWLSRACEAFVGERALLTRLTVAAGPITSTPGQDRCTSAIINLRGALNALSQSDRQGCALGAAFALVLDWIAIRDVLDLIGERTGLDGRRSTLPAADETRQLAAELSINGAIGRAIGFGASQMLLQHRQLWDMLCERADLRRAQDGF
ncbi:hypothetical protein GCM10010833_25620 [Blastomonas aquatica]|uniref:Uncharacterized protein n=1 Tax=Blastomonas aquatica TaxID=1510276 RepID=A0ABQ1JKA5_9SPHN|nr:hypothetical protein GCM10010833_25620 [Blastomonas aquatica]